MTLPTIGAVRSRRQTSTQGAAMPIGAALDINVWGIGAAIEAMRVWNGMPST